jgi:dipeptidyl-peptidase-4
MWMLKSFRSNHRFVVFAAILLLVFRLVTPAQDKLLTIDDIYDPNKKVNFSGNPPLGLRWLKDGIHYLQSRSDRESGLSQLLKVNALTGQSTPFFDAAKMESALAKLEGISTEAAKQLSHRSSYQMNSSETAAIINYANDLFYYEFGSDTAIRLTNNKEEETEEEFSPDGRMVSFVRNNNLYVIDIATRQEHQLTGDGGQKILNGRLDWVYQEELYGRGNYKGYWWSPDSRKLAYLRLDETPVSEFVIVDHIPHLQAVEAMFYPKAGDPNPRVQLGVINAAGGQTTWIDLSKYKDDDLLVSRVDWMPDSQSVVYQAQNREQTWLDLNFANTSDGKAKTVLHEASKAWVEVIDNPHWLKDGSFLWQSERTGYRHIYHYDQEGKLIRQVTDGKWEVRSLDGVDEAQGWIYFSSNQHSPIANHEYRIKLDGTSMTRLSQMEGNHSVSFNPQLTHYIDYRSDISTPIQVRLYRADGPLVRVIDENRVEALRQYKLGKPEFLQVKTRDGFVMEAMMIKPPDFDPNKKYPVMSYTYSGPHAQSVRNSWGGQSYMWHQMLAQRGYIIWICDNRTASGKGVESAWPLYHNFGELELRDLEDAIAWLKSLPFVDSSRIGIWGWSFGGFMTCYALTHSQSFRIGIAGGSVTDWRLYDTIYTERYMQTPQNNPEGYKKSAPQMVASNLHGKLLLIHGTMDDNVHMQNTIQLAYELQKAGKQFQLMLYPKSRHGLTDPYLIKHMRTMMTEFILQNL